MGFPNMDHLLAMSGMALATGPMPRRIVGPVASGSSHYMRFAPSCRAMH